jgi:hypothetical protein
LGLGPANDAALYHGWDARAKRGPVSGTVYIKLKTVLMFIVAVFQVNCVG